MKKLMYAIVILLLSGILAGCNSNDESESELEDTNETTEKVENEDVEEDVDEGTVEVDRGLFNVEITLPPAFLGSDEEIAQIVAEAEEEGFSEVTKNDDGSLTYKMSRAKHKEMMDEMEANITETIEDIVADEEVASVYEISPNNAFSHFTVLVDQVVFENSFDGFAIMALGMGGLLYQLFDGVSPDDYEVQVDLEDMNTGEVFSTINFPEVFEDMGNVEEVE